MTALDRLVGRALGRPNRSLSPARTAILGLAIVLAIGGAVVALRPSPGSGPDRTPAPSAASEFWGLLYDGFEATGPAYRSLADLGERSEAVVEGVFTGEVEPGREPCDEQSLANGVPRAQACVFFANLPFRIDAILAGSLPEGYRETVKLEYMVRPQRQEALADVAPTTERIVLFIGSKYLRRAGIEDVYYALGIGQGTFRDVDGRVVPLGLPDDPEFGRLEGMAFDQFVELVRRVTILDLMPEG